MSAGADPHGVLATGIAHAPPSAGAFAHEDLRVRVGLRLRASLELAGGVRRLSAPQDRGRRGAASGADGAGSRLRVEVLAAMSFRRRVVLLAAGAVAAAIVIASVVVYVVTGNELHARIDASLRQKLTPGHAQAVQIKTVNVAAAQLAKLIREGKPPPEASGPIGLGQSVTRVALPRGAAVAAGSSCAKAVLRSI